jgi:hypothetical protein
MTEDGLPTSERRYRIHAWFWLAGALMLPVMLAGLGLYWLNSESAWRHWLFTEFFPLVVGLIAFTTVRVFLARRHHFAILAVALGGSASALALAPILNVFLAGAHGHIVATWIAVLALLTPVTILEVAASKLIGQSPRAAAVYWASGILFLLFGTLTATSYPYGGAPWLDAISKCPLAVPYLVFLGVVYPRPAVWRLAACSVLVTGLVWGLTAARTFAIGRPGERAALWPLRLAQEHVPRSEKQKILRGVPISRKPQDLSQLKLGPHTFDAPRKWVRGFTELKYKTGEVEVESFFVLVAPGELLSDLDNLPGPRHRLKSALYVRAELPSRFQPNLSLSFCDDGLYDLSREFEDRCLAKWPYRGLRLSVSYPRMFRPREDEMKRAIERLLERWLVD